MGAIDVTPLGEPRPASRADEEIVADALADIPGIWRPVDLGVAAEQGVKAYAGVAARLGPQIDPEDPGAPPPEVADVADAEAVAVAERFHANETFTLRQATPGRRRVIRRIAAARADWPEQADAWANPSHRSQAPSMLGEPQPEIRVPRHAATSRALRAQTPHDRSGMVLAILLMIGVWAGVVGGAAWFFNTPGSGVKIQWR